MSTDITVTNRQINLALHGIIIQMRNSGIADKYESFAHAMHEMNLWDYAFNQASVMAHGQQYNNKLHAIIHNRPSSQG